jgi:hypothetical protein
MIAPLLYSNNGQDFTSPALNYTLSYPSPFVISMNPSHKSVLSPNPVLNLTMSGMVFSQTVAYLNKTALACTVIESDQVCRLCLQRLSFARLILQFISYSLFDFSFTSGSDLSVAEYRIWSAVLWRCFDQRQ